MTGLEPVNLFLTKEVLYLLSYMGNITYKWRQAPEAENIIYLVPGFLLYK